MLALFLLLLPFALLGLHQLLQEAVAQPPKGLQGGARPGSGDRNSPRRIDCFGLPQGMAVAGRYRVGPLLGRGGMAAVYEAEDQATGLKVALKLAPISGPAALDACQLEALLGKEVRGTGLVPVSASGCWRGNFYLAMERLEGCDLSRLMAQEGPIAVQRVLQWGIEAAEALALLHRAGVVHCDVKPSNLFVCSDGSVRLIDLGIARRPGSQEQSDRGEVVGSPSYMAPERFRGVDGDLRSDLWALGATLYEALAGRRAYPGKGMVQICARVLQGSAKPLAEVRSGLPPALEELISSLLDPDLDARPVSAAAVAEALKTIQQQSPMAA